MTVESSRQDLFERIQLLHSEGATGVLEVQLGPGKRRLFFRDGEIYLGASHPLAQKLAHYLQVLKSKQSADDAAVRETREGLLGLVQRMSAVISEWRGSPLRFEEGVSRLPIDLVGPLPTLRLVMRGASLGCGIAELERASGWPQQRWIAPASQPRFDDVLGLLPEELWLLEKLRVVTSVEAVCQQAPVDRVAVLCSLVELAAVGCVQREHAEPLGAREQKDHHRDTVIERLFERFERDLEEEPLNLDPMVHRQKLAKLLGEFGGMDHYELLGLSSTNPSSDEIQAAYEMLGRVVHPHNARHLGWEDRKAALQLLFEQVTQAYLTLIDPGRRIAYNREALIDVGGPSKSGAEREREQHEVAKDLYQKACHYHQIGERHFAKELYFQAVRLHPLPQYWVAIGDLEFESASSLPRAIDAYRSALELDHNSVAARLGLARIYDRLGDVGRARVQYTAVARLDPGNLEASSALRRLQALPAKSSGGLISRLFRRE